MLYLHSIMEHKRTLVELSINTIPIGTPLNFALRDKNGTLLASQGYTIRDQSELKKITDREQMLMVDINESDLALRAYLLRINKMLLTNKDLVDIVSAKLTLEDIDSFKQTTIQGQVHDYLDNLFSTAILLRHPEKETFLMRIEKLQKELTFLITKYPDASIAAMVYLSNKEIHNYSAMHALLIWVVVTITARTVLKWDDTTVDTLGKVALTMNISIVNLQDQLARQNEPLNAYQQNLIFNHPLESRKILCEMGITNQLWLDAVLHKKDQTPGPMNKKNMAQKLGRLIQRSDIFGARLAPRMHRPPLSIIEAIQASYLDEQKQPDEIGTAIVMALGVYAPGSFVKLVSGETAIVTKRQMARPGVMGKSPYVAIVLNKDGFPVGELIERNTSIANYKIEKAVNMSDVKVYTPLEKVLSMSNRKLP